MSKDCFVLIGRPLGGKETLKGGFEKIVHSPIHLPMGNKMREESKKENSPIGHTLAAYMNRGRLVPDEVTLSFANTLLGQIPENSLLLSDGFPRTIGQIDGAFEIFHQNGMNRICILHIDTPAEECLRRAEQKNGDRGDRIDDHMDTVRTRLAIYEDETVPVLRELSKRSCELKCSILHLPGLNMQRDAEMYAKGLATLHGLKTN